MESKREKERIIEGVVEKIMDVLDKTFLEGEMTQEEYEGKARLLDSRAEEIYREMCAGRSGSY